MYYLSSLPPFPSVIHPSFQISWWHMNFNNAAQCTTKICPFVPMIVTMIYFIFFPNRSCTGKTTPSLTLLAKCAYLETTRWLTSQGWKRTQCTTSVWPHSIRLAPGHSRRPSTPPQRNHVSPSQRGIEIIYKWSLFMNHVSPSQMTSYCPQHDRRSTSSALLVVLIKFNVTRELSIYIGGKKERKKMQSIVWVEHSYSDNLGILNGQGMLKLIYSTPVQTRFLKFGDLSHLDILQNVWKSNHLMHLFHDTSIVKKIG